MQIFVLLLLVAFIVTSYGRELSVPVIVDVDWLAENRKNVLLLDVSYTMSPKPDPTEFAKTSFGKFSKMIAEKNGAAYESTHIPGAVHFNMDIGFYPSQYIRFDLYNSSLFTEYARLLGVNDNSRIVVYGRGSFAGMMWAARVWWTFKYYGFDNISILNGGFDAWKAKGLPIESGTTTIPVGNWTSKGERKEILVTFDQLNSKDSQGKSIFDKLDEVNFLDARPRDEFIGKKPLSIKAVNATGTHIKGSKNVPLSDVIGPNGMKSKEEIEKVLRTQGFVDGKPTYTFCVTGIQSSLLYAVLASVGHDAAIFNGSLTEIAARASQLINATGP